MKRVVVAVLSCLGVLMGGSAIAEEAVEAEIKSKRSGDVLLIEACAESHADEEIFVRYEFRLKKEGEKGDKSESLASGVVALQPGEFQKLSRFMVNSSKIDAELKTFVDRRMTSKDRFISNMLTHK